MSCEPRLHPLTKETPGKPTGLDTAIPDESLFFFHFVDDYAANAVAFNIDHGADNIDETVDGKKNTDDGGGLLVGEAHRIDDDDERDKPRAGDARCAD